MEWRADGDTCWQWVLMEYLLLKECLQFRHTICNYWKNYHTLSTCCATVVLYFLQSTAWLIANWKKIFFSCCFVHVANQNPKWDLVEYQYQWYQWPASSEYNFVSLRSFAHKNNAILLLCLYCFNCNNYNFLITAWSIIILPGHLYASSISHFVPLTTHA